MSWLQSNTWEGQLTRVHCHRNTIGKHQCGSIPIVWQQKVLPNFESCFVHSCLWISRASVPNKTSLIVPKWHQITQSATQSATKSIQSDQCSFWSPAKSDTKSARPLCEWIIGHCGRVPNQLPKQLPNELPNQLPKQLPNELPNQLPNHARKALLGLHQISNQIKDQIDYQTTHPIIGRCQITYQNSYQMHYQISFRTPPDSSTSGMHQISYQIKHQINYQIKGRCQISYQIYYQMNYQISSQTTLHYGRCMHIRTAPNQLPI